MKRIALCLVASFLFFGFAAKTYAESCEEQLSNCVIVGMSVAMEADLKINKLAQENAKLKEALTEVLAQNMLLKALIESTECGKKSSSNGEMDI